MFEARKKGSLMPKIPTGTTWSTPSTAFILVQALLLASSLTSTNAECCVSVWAAAFIPEKEVSAVGTSCTYNPCEDTPRWLPCTARALPGYNSGDVRTDPEIGGSSRVYMRLDVDVDSGEVYSSKAGVGESKCLKPNGDVISRKCSDPDFSCSVQEPDYLWGGQRLNLEYTAPNPYLPLNADRTSIRGDFSLEIRDKRHSYGDCEEFEYVLTGSHSEYPSHEVFIGSENIYFAEATGTAQLNVPQNQDVGYKSGIIRPRDKDVYAAPPFECWGSSENSFCSA